MGLGLHNVQNEFPLLGNQKLKVTVDFSLAAWNTAATHRVFLVSGLVRMVMFYNITASLTSGGAALIAFGSSLSTGEYAAAQAFTGLTTGVHVRPGGSFASRSYAWLSWFVNSNGADMISGGINNGYEITVAAMTGGTMDAYCFWTPISDGSTVTAGTGAAF